MYVNRVVAAPDNSSSYLAILFDTIHPYGFVLPDITGPRISPDRLAGGTG